MHSSSGCREAGIPMTSGGNSEQQVSACVEIPCDARRENTLHIGYRPTEKDGEQEPHQWQIGDLLYRLVPPALQRGNVRVLHHLLVRLPCVLLQPNMPSCWPPATGKCEVWPAYALACSCKGAAHAVRVWPFCEHACDGHHLERMCASGRRTPLRGVGCGSTAHGGSTRSSPWWRLSRPARWARPSPTASRRPRCCCGTAGGPSRWSSPTPPSQQAAHAARAQ
jgi:hypothetical protein